MKNILATLFLLPVLSFAGPVELVPAKAPVDMLNPQVIENPYVGGDAWVDFYAVGTETTVGAGVAATYFLTKNIGLGAEALYHEEGLGYTAGGTLIIRFPEETLIVAPYLVFAAGAGEQTYYAGGLGLSVALDHDFDLFAEGRYYFGDEKDFAEVRLGMGFRFW